MATWWENSYPARYYAAYDTTAAQPTAVTAWIDVAMFGAQPEKLPAASDMLALTAEQWMNGPSGKGVSGEKLVDYTPPPPVIPLKTQAIAAQAWIQHQATLAAAMGEVFTADMKAYVKAIAAIANGTGTTSTALPAQPTDVMTTSAATTAGV